MPTKTKPRKRASSKAKSRTAHHQSALLLAERLAYQARIVQMRDTPIPTGLLDEIHLRVLSACATILRGEAITYHWATIVDSINLLDCARQATKQRPPLVNDECGVIGEAAASVKRAIDRKHRTGADHALLDGEGLSHVRQVLAALPELLESLTYGQYLQLLRDTNRQLAAAQRNPPPGTVVIDVAMAVKEDEE